MKRYIDIQQRGSCRTYLVHDIGDSGLSISRDIFTDPSADPKIVYPRADPSMGPQPWDPPIPTIYPICTLKGSLKRLEGAY